MNAKRIKEFKSCYEYRNYCIHKPEGSKYWNVRKIEDGEINWCFSECVCESFSEAKTTIDYMYD